MSTSTPSNAAISASGAQHVEMYRKSLLRKRLLTYSVPGAAYVPFIGDGDLATIHYANRQVFGADLDPDRVAVATSVLRGGDIVRVADCDAWPFPDIKTVFSVGDFDAYSEPYRSFRSFWAQANRADRLVLFFTDGHRLGLIRTGHWHLPDGSKQYLASREEKLPVFNFYLQRYVWPWFETFIKPYKVVTRFRYLRSHMTYWGAVIER
jgi:hypothetical protein